MSKTKYKELIELKEGDVFIGNWADGSEGNFTVKEIDYSDESVQVHQHSFNMYLDVFPVIGNVNLLQEA